MVRTSGAGQGGRRRAGLSDVAAQAGVSLATVDRVLNERGATSPEVTRRVVDAARQLGLRRVLPAPYQGGLRLDVLLMRPDSAFLARLNQAFARVAASLDRSVMMERSFLDERRPRDVATRIRATRGQALIVYCEEDPLILDAIAAAVAAGTFVVTIVSDLPAAPRHAFVGIDQTGAGRAAAFFLARMAPEAGDVIALTHGKRYRAHAQRVAGFRDALAAHGPGLIVTAVLEGRDEPDLSKQMIAEALAANPRIRGIYNTGGVLESVAEAMARFPERRITLVGHELTAESASLLRRGTLSIAIDQNPEQHARQAVELILRHFGFRSDGAIDGTVPFTIHGAENLGSL